MVDLPAIAVIADAHFHDIHSAYECAHYTLNGKPATLRSWKDTRRSSRVFNESRGALETALADIQQRGIRHIVLLGDYTDDGQIEATRRLTDILHHYRRQYDMAFYAIPGNHDIFGPAGKHQSTRFVTTPGHTVLVTSDADVAATEKDTAVLTNKMYCEGSPAGLLPMAKFGLFRQPDYVHWETPFGRSDATQSRMFDAHSADRSVAHSLMDSSYLVEPCDGLWLLMIDANVFEPRNGRKDPARKSTFMNSSDAGWNSVLRVKPHLLEWISDVCKRAELSDKHLIAFSHYPIINTIDNQTEAEVRLFGQSEVARRTPDASVAEALLSAGLRLHFSGHMHVNNEAHLKIDEQRLTNIAVPSLVAFPACYKIIQPAQQSNQITTVPLDAMPVDQTLIALYREENKTAGTENEPALSAKNYGDFLYKKMLTRVKHRYLIKEWPQDIACQIENTTVADLAYFMLAQQSRITVTHFGPTQEMVITTMAADLDVLATQHQLTRNDFNHCSMMTLLADWYCLRQAGPLAGAYVGTQKRKLYTCLANLPESSEPATDTHAAFFNLFLSVLKRSLKNLHSGWNPMPHTTELIDEFKQ